MIHAARRHGMLAVLVVLLLCCGCTKQGNVTVTGSVVRGGQPLPVSKTGVVQVTLMPDVGENEQYTTYVGRCDNTGKFEIVDVPPGKYRIGIEHLDPNPQVDKLNSAFSYANAKFVREIDGKAPVVIDLAKPGS
jgi:hypothetical protein